jgi:succinate dehydrogenase hydrophobic anchor subunit
MTLVLTMLYVFAAFFMKTTWDDKSPPNISARISQPFSSVLLSQQININISISHLTVLL